MTTPRKNARKSTRTTSNSNSTEKTNAEVTNQQTETQAEPKQNTPKNVTKRSVRITIDHQELVPCVSTVKNNLVYVSRRTAEKFIWANYGDVHYITFGELISMKSTLPRMLSEGWLIVDDEEAINQLGIMRMYGTLLEIESMDEFFDLDDLEEMERILKGLPMGYRKNLGVFARERIQDGRLDSNKKIKLLEEYLEVDLKIFNS